MISGANQYDSAEARKAGSNIAEAYCDNRIDRPDEPRRWADAGKYLDAWGHGIERSMHSL